ncbi:hypothetical protein P1X15_21335 [Runella sp. MFBS21]|uniref:hypothetical protein n=1 Tax=Runella sp. MFBS21 TaxID=3034018 RepID=UPI0023F73FD8|nr:hypothetical protein [Runella sp. MFBS21]MDF7820177.1 hypothetical protein [Runella sp. MFBS21]
MPTPQVINFVGEYTSIINAFAERFKAAMPNEHLILHEIFNRYHDIGNEAGNDQQPLLVLVIDEFGKFLEYAIGHEPEREFYFIQQLAEFVNNPHYNICLITAVHQNIDAYSFSLNDTQRKEWAKVKGRFREITFNEPVEQLLYLVGEHTINTTFIPDKAAKSGIDTALKLAQRSKAVTLPFAEEANIAAKLFPLDSVSAVALTLALQRYGQNERSLFSFLQSTDYTGLNQVKLSEKNPFYNVANVFDYLTFNFYSYLNSKENRDYTAWMGIRSTLEKIEAQFGEEVKPYEKIVKTVGLLAILIPFNATLDRKFLIEYSQVCLGITDAEQHISNLEHWNIIRYRNYRGRYLLNEGTDLDVQVELSKAGNDIEQIRDISAFLQRYYQLPPVLAKRHSYQTGTPRLFEYWISEHPLSRVPEGEIDGYINLIFSQELTFEALCKHATAQGEAIIYAYYQHTDQIREQLRNIEKTQIVIERHEEDKIALRELSQILEHQKKLLNHLILDGLFMPGHVTWVFQDKVRTINSARELNQWLSDVCNDVYKYAPTFKNELVNRHKLSSQIGTAKKAYLQALTNKWNEPNLGFEEERFPPEKTIYLTLLVQNGFLDALKQDNLEEVTSEQFEDLISETFRPLWRASKSFLISTKQLRRSIADLIDLLSLRPFKLKQGLIEFWVSTFLFIKRDDFALFEEGRYVPDITADVLELIIKEPRKYAIKAFIIDGLRLNLFNGYRHLFQLNTEVRFSNVSFIETIKPLLTFYTRLPEYTKQTKHLSREALATRLAIEKSQEPEKTFFEDLPIALGYSTHILQNSSEHFEEFIESLQVAIKELRTAYDDLLNRFESLILKEYIGEEIAFNDYKSRLQSRFGNLRPELLSSAQKTFLQRLNSPLDDRNAWFNSIAQVVVGKPLTALRDTDENLLYDRLKRLIRELDNLTNLTDLNIDSEREEVFSLKIGTLVDGLQEELVRLPKSKKGNVTTAEIAIRKQLGNDLVVNVAALTNILKELIK